MRLLLILLLVFSFACKSLSEHEKKKGILTGEWIVLYPDHQLRNQRQRDLYKKMQDSIVGETALKLVRLTEDGRFQQMDSLSATGTWILEENDDIIISNGGTGFNYLRSTYKTYNEKELESIEHVGSGGEIIRLVWHWKKLNRKDLKTNLFGESENRWRIKASKKESMEELKTRLEAMLVYYSQYYKIVSKEASFFIGGRVMMPFRFYQHGVGMRPFDPGAPFTKLFFDLDDAEKAHKLLDRAMDKLGEYPSGKDFVEEYAMVMENLAKEVRSLE